jgi:hypothetical protein
MAILARAGALTSVHVPSAVDEAARDLVRTGQRRDLCAAEWRAQQRLHRRYRHLLGHGKRSAVAIIAVARELTGFVWAALTRS